MNAFVSMSSLCLSVLLVQSGTALKWSPSPRDGEIIYTCVDYAVTLVWGYVLDPGDVLHSTEWNYDGLSREMVAISAHGNFFAAPSFSHRVRFVPNAGLSLSHVTMGDTGNYSVMVTGQDSSGAGFTMHRTVLLQVADDLRTTDHELHAAQQPVAEFNKDTDQWHAVLTCGHFTFPSDPPVWVEWQTPDNQTVPSTLYRDGLFMLSLPNPVTEGSYTCTVSPSALNVSCHHGDSQQDSVQVNGIVTRLTLIEGQQRSVRAEFTTKMDRLQADNVQKDAIINNLTSNQDRLQADSIQKDAIIKELTTKVETIQADLNQTRPVVFSARLLGNLHLYSGGTLILPDVLLNEGNAYSNSTGKFTAPVTGLYFFSAMAAAYTHSRYAALALRSTSAATVGDVFRSWAYAGSDGHKETGSLQGAVHLQRGELVWLQQPYESYYLGGADTVFSGFLISAE